MNNILTQKDIESLSSNLNAENKALTALKVGAYYNDKNITPRGMLIVESIFRIMVKDVQLKVREALSESLKNCRNIPADIVKSLIADEDSVALPFIKYYADLTHEDIISILEIPNVNKHKAVAMRKNLPEDISQYIAENCTQDVIGILISNDSANIKDATFDFINSKYPDSQELKERMVYRADLPITVIEKIINSLSVELQKRLVITHNLPNDIASDIVEQVKEKTTLRVSEEYSSDKQIEELIHQLYTANRLTTSLVVRSICLGDLKFFEYALVYLSNTPIAEVRKILFNSNMDFMIRNLLRKAYIPKGMFPAVFSALKVIKDVHFDYKHNDRKAFTHKVIERILSYGSAGNELSDEDINYLISKIS